MMTKSTEILFKFQKEPDGTERTVVCFFQGTSTYIGIAYTYMHGQDGICWASERERNHPENPLPWFVLRLRSNYEKTTAQMLSNQGYEVFLPTSRARRRWTDRVK